MSRLVNRHVRTGITLVALVGLLAVGGYIGWQRLSAPVDTPSVATKPTGPSCTKGVSKGDRVRSRDVTVSVYNAGTRSGLAAETLDRLVSRRFIAGEVGNAPRRMSGVRFVRVLAPKKNDPAARLVAVQFGRDTFVQRTRTDLGPGVDVIVGNDFQGLVKAPRSIIARAAGSGC